MTGPQGPDLNPPTGPPAWSWGCLACADGGAADSAEHAASLERIHRFFSCPHAPGLDPDERARREVWRATKKARYEDHEHPDTARWKKDPKEN